MYRRIGTFQRTLWTLHGADGLLAGWRLQTWVVFLLIIGVLSNIVGGAIQELASSLIENTSSISIAILHSLRRLARLRILQLFEILFGILGSLDHFLVEIVVFVIVWILGLTVLHGALHVFLILLVIIRFLHNRWLFLLFSRFLLGRWWQLRWTCRHAHDLPGLRIIQFPVDWVLIALFLAIFRDDAEGFSLTQVFVVRHHYRFFLFGLDRRFASFEALLDFLGVRAGLEGVIHRDRKSVV